MTDRKRDPLPQGYQFGDAGKVRDEKSGVALRLIQQWGLDGSKDVSAFDVKVHRASKMAAFLTGAPDYDPSKHGTPTEVFWNVIEADHFDADRDPGDETPWAV